MKVLIIISKIFKIQGQIKNQNILFKFMKKILSHLKFNDTKNFKLGHKNTPK